MPEITLAEFRRRPNALLPWCIGTPVLSSRRFNEAAGADCFFKCENFQRGGAFKMRGAANFALSLSDAERARGVVTFSSGNHGQAVAIAASDLNMPATIVMPDDHRNPSSMRHDLTVHALSFTTAAPKIGRRLVTGSPPSLELLSYRRMIIPGPSPGKERRFWNCSTTCPTWMQSALPPAEAVCWRAHPSQLNQSILTSKYSALSRKLRTIGLCRFAPATRSRSHSPKPLRTDSEP